MFDESHGVRRRSAISGLQVITTQHERLNEKGTWGTQEAKEAKATSGAAREGQYIAVANV